MTIQSVPMRFAKGRLLGLSRPKSAPSGGARAFAHTAFFACICLQRFGIPLGSESYVSICLPILWGLTGWMLISGRAQLSTKTSLMFLAFSAWVLMSAIGAVLVPDSRSGFSILSMLELLTLYVALVVRPAAGFDGKVVQEIFLGYVRLCAVCGILQFGLQFAHLRLFSFGEIVPALKPILIERGFAWHPLLSYGSSTLRSNGFFLLEPSIFSQVLAIAIILDVFIMGRLKFLPLYLMAYMVTFSGTGLLSLALTLTLVGLASPKNFLGVAAFGVAAVIVAGLFSLVFPGQFATFLGRFNELGNSGSSGHARYLAQAQEFQDYVGETRALLGYGPGATVRSIHYVKGSGNPVLQLFVDYGWVGLGLFAAFLTVAVWRHGYAALAIVMLIDFQLGGGYLLFAPFTLLLATLLIWGTGTTPARAPAREPARRRFNSPRPVCQQA